MFQRSYNEVAVQNHQITADALLRSFVRQVLNTGVVVVGLCGLLSPASAIERLTIDNGGVRRQLDGRVLVEAQDGGLLFESQDARIWTIAPEQLRSRDSDTVEFRYLDRDELAENLLAELPADFRIHTTAHYLILYNTSHDYARWCGSLFEKLHRAYFTFWRRHRMQLSEPPVLVAIVFRDQASYAKFGRDELRDAVDAIIGYYSLATNRITTYDMTGLEQLRQPGDRTGSLQHINQILARPAAAATVATLIHEATHQLAFNSGLQRRFADNPLWLSEGLAIYFESPDLASSRGWRGIGGLHAQRLATMRDYLSDRPPDSLLTLVSNDGRFRDTQRAEVAYAEAWSLCYFLLRQRPEQFADYLRQIAAKPVLGQDTSAQRVQQFQQVFGQNLSELDQQLLRAVPTWR